MVDELDHGDGENEVGQNKDEIDEITVPVRLVAGGVSEKNVADGGQQISGSQEGQIAKTVGPLLLEESQGKGGEKGIGEGISKRKEVDEKWL